MSPFEQAGDALGAALTGDECETLTDLFCRASEALQYLAEQACAGDGAEDYQADATDLLELADALTAGERAHR